MAVKSTLSLDVEAVRHLAGLVKQRLRDWTGTNEPAALSGLVLTEAPADLSPPPRISYSSASSDSGRTCPPSTVIV